MMEVPAYAYDELTLGNKTHFEISTPILYQRHPDSKNYWRFTPYYQYQSFGQSNYVDANDFIYSFSIQEPVSRTHIIGIRAEFGLGL